MAATQVTVHSQCQPAASLQAWQHPAACRAGRADLLYASRSSPAPPRPAGHSMSPGIPPGFPPTQGPPGFAHQLPHHLLGPVPGLLHPPGSVLPPSMPQQGPRGPEQRHDPHEHAVLPRPAGEADSAKFRLYQDRQVGRMYTRLPACGGLDYHDISQCCGQHAHRDRAQPTRSP